MADKSLYGRLKKIFSIGAYTVKKKDGRLNVFDFDEKQTTNLSMLRDRYTKIQKSSYMQAGGAQSMAYQQVRREVFRDYDAMDNDSILASALDIYADECLSGETKIPLLNGDVKTIQELYSDGYTDFWVYGIDDNMNFKPVKASKVSYNGKKNVKKIVFDDGTEIKCTDNHIWILPDGSEVKTSELKVGDGIFALNTKISTDTRMNGYRMISNNKGNFEYVHRIVANNTSFLKEQKDKFIKKFDKVYIHHTSFDKLNNSPDELEWIDAVSHKKIHAEFNKKLWKDINENINLRSNYYEKLISGQKKYWNSDKGRLHSISHSIRMKEYMKSIGSDVRSKLYGKSGKDNPMYGNGYKISGNKNGRFNENSYRFSESDVELLLIEIRNHNYSYNSLPIIRKKLNVIDHEWNTFIKFILDKFNCYNSKQLLSKLFALDNSTILADFRKYYINNNIEGKRFFVEDFCKNNNISNNFLHRLINASGYKNISEFINSSNHRIISITDAGVCDVYDLVNTGDNHRYAILSNDDSLIYTHNCTLKDEFGDVLKITSENQRVIDELHNLFYDVLNIEFNLWPWVRNLCKYGDFFLALEISDEYGIVNVTPQSVYNTERLEMTDPNNPNFVKFRIEEDPIGKGEYDNYEIAHFRLLSDTNWLPYGKSMIENGRRLWKQLSLMEDAMLIHRIMRAPEKRMFKIDIGNIPPGEVDNYMQKIINKMKKIPFIDRNTGDYNLKYNIQNLTEDFFMPVRGSDSGTSIENLSGLEYAAIDDIDYLKAKLFAALKIPKAYLGYEENISGKATLAAEDVRFARTIERIQRTVVSELSKIAVIHLYALGFSQKDILNFELSLVNPSTIYEQEKVNLWTEKVRLASDMLALKMISKEWIYKNIFSMSEDELYVQQGKVISDIKETFRHNTIEQEGNDPNEKEKEETGKPKSDGDSNENNGDGSDGIEPKKPVGGRPPEGNTYGKDKHPYGRDPLGDKENSSKMSRQAESSLLKSLTKLKSKNRLLRD